MAVSGELNRAEAYQSEGVTPRGRTPRATSGAPATVADGAMSENRPEEARAASLVVGLREDERGDWIARLDCGHERHVRHDPPWTNHPWVTSAAGRAAALGRRLRCGRCARHSPRAAPADGSA